MATKTAPGSEKQNKRSSSKTMSYSHPMGPGGGDLGAVHQGELAINLGRFHVQGPQPSQTWGKMWAINMSRGTEGVSSRCKGTVDFVGDWGVTKVT